ncbi:MAG: hypothetical protein ABIH70_03485 [Chloroflexota bacterium]
MKNRRYQVMLTAIFLFLILLPPFEQITGIIPEPRLIEKRQLTPMPSVVLDSFLFGEFQTQFDAYMNDNFGFRALMVMMNNQINVMVFHVTR